MVYELDKSCSLNPHVQLQYKLHTQKELFLLTFVFCIAVVLKLRLPVFLFLLYSSILFTGLLAVSGPYQFSGNLLLSSFRSMFTNKAYYVLLHQIRQILVLQAMQKLNQYSYFYISKNYHLFKVTLGKLLHLKISKQHLGNSSANAHV